MKHAALTSYAPRTLRSSEPGSIVVANADRLPLEPTMDPGSAPRYAQLGRETCEGTHAK